MCIRWRSRIVRYKKILTILVCWMWRRIIEYSNSTNISNMRWGHKIVWTITITITIMVIRNKGKLAVEWMSWLPGCMLSSSRPWRMLRGNNKRLIGGMCLIDKHLRSLHMRESWECSSSFSRGRIIHSRGRLLLVVGVVEGGSIVPIIGIDFHVLND